MLFYYSTTSTIATVSVQVGDWCKQVSGLMHLINFSSIETSRAGDSDRYIHTTYNTNRIFQHFKYLEHWLGARDHSARLASRGKTVDKFLHFKGSALTFEWIDVLLIQYYVYRQFCPLGTIENLTKDISNHEHNTKKLK